MTVNVWLTEVNETGGTRMRIVSASTWPHTAAQTV